MSAPPYYGLIPPDFYPPVINADTMKRTRENYNPPNWRTYDPSKVVIKWGPFTLQGFEDGEFVSTPTHDPTLLDRVAEQLREVGSIAVAETVAGETMFVRTADNEVRARRPDDEWVHVGEVKVDTKPASKPFAVKDSDGAWYVPGEIKYSDKPPAPASAVDARVDAILERERELQLATRERLTQILDAMEQLSRGCTYALDSYSYGYRIGDNLVHWINRGGGGFRVCTGSYCPKIGPKGADDYITVDPDERPWDTARRLLRMDYNQPGSVATSANGRGCADRRS